MTSAKLLAVVEVPREDRVRCQASGCNHVVFRRIHVVREKEVISIYGSECFKKLFAGAPDSFSVPYYTTADGRHLTDEERQLLLENTARLIQQFEAEHQAELERKAALAPPSLPPAVATTPPTPKALTFTTADRQAAEAQAKQLLRKQYGINPELPGWHGLVQSEAERILRGNAG